jgi:hypothetical protein
MGLDTYAARIPVDFFDPDLDETEVDEWFGCTWQDRLALWRLERRRERASGGFCLFAGNYFRGGIYNDLVRYVTGVTLEQTWIPPETVGKMAEAFERRDPEATIRAFGRKARYDHRHSARDVADLAAFFRLCADRGLGLVGSW